MAYPVARSMANANVSLQTAPGSVAVRAVTPRVGRSSVIGTTATGFRALVQAQSAPAHITPSPLPIDGPDCFIWHRIQSTPSPHFLQNTSPIGSPIPLRSPHLIPSSPLPFLCTDCTSEQVTPIFEKTSSLIRQGLGLPAERGVAPPSDWRRYATAAQRYFSILGR